MKRMRLITRRMLLVVFCFAKTASSQRALNWAIRVSDLEATLNFTNSVLGMKTLRHEENDKPCPIKRNGGYDTRWSRTMVGYNREDSAYALELTYNYGVGAYEKGQGLDAFRVVLDSVVERSDVASSLGYAVKYASNGVRHITGPDGYEFTLVPKHHGNGGHDREEPFSTVVLRTRDTNKMAAFYKSFFGMKGMMMMALDPLDTVHVVGFQEHSVRFAIAGLQKPPKITQWEGRNTISLPEKAVRELNRRLLEEAPELILHELREVEEKLGILLILTLRDPAGYEVCVVSSETFDDAVGYVTDYQGPDWDLRTSLHEQHYFGAKDEL